MTLKLFGHDPSPYVRRVRILLIELGIPFERDANGWTDPSAEFQKASPIQRLPVLDRGPDATTRYVYDSRVIASALYEVAQKAANREEPAPELPSSAPRIQPTLWNAALDFADQNVLTTADAVLDSGINVFLLERDGVTLAQSPYLERQSRRVIDCLAWLENVYKNKRTLTEGQLSYADIAMACALAWLRFRQRADLNAFPALVAAEAEMQKRPSFAATFVY